MGALLEGGAVKLNDLLDVDLLGQMVRDGWVRIQRHPQHTDLAIANYTDACAFARVWNDVTRVCRGLIWDLGTNEVLARPFPKFFNHREPGAPVLAPNTPVEVTDKLDGSLGILYPIDGGWAIATRGSFDSEQARHATQLLRSKYSDSFSPLPHLTYLFEIIYRDNRIVVDYGPTDDLFLLGAVRTHDGLTFPPDLVDEWPGPRAAVFGFGTFAEALAAPPRSNAEGIVVRELGTANRIKIKQDDYVQLHRIITGCTKRRLWEHLAVHECKHFLDPSYLVKRLYLAPDKIKGILDVGEDWLGAYLTNTPEEFREWVVARVTEMHNEVARRKMLHRAQLLVLCAHLGVHPPTGVPDRALSKRFTELVAQKCPQDFHMIMGLWRGQEIVSELWRQVRPEHEVPFRQLDEAVA